MPQLKNDVQVFIVQSLAQFKTPQEVADLVAKEFGVQIDRMQVNSYDPSKIYFKGSRKWKSVFNRAREEFLSDIKKIPIANKSYRLQIVQDSLDRLLSNPRLVNHKMMLEFLEYAAKEEGGMFTNRREITGANGRDILPADMAKQVFKGLIDEAGFTNEEALEFVMDRYKVEKNEVLDAEFIDWSDKEN